MKRIYKKIILITLIIASLFSVISCFGGSGSGMKKYSESGLNFSLPEDMEIISVKYADICYGNDDFTQFFVYFYPKDSLLTDLALDKEATVKEYSDRFIGMNGYTNVEESYDEANRTIVLKYVYTDGYGSEYYCDYITRNEDVLYHVTMCCKAELMDKYAPIFDDWMSYISID